ncbi:hypothetical protein DAPPUDRAFT_246339 [Daphnia pulex]|uniref:Peptidase S1 domain-containing protein n=1 Tax=Daphnia pulex TaxID=6669 RepID=E9GQ85_DAPPU|nr:hypothetical protein DAPPUDRAFT_246339 [Daphnia pulex]|eukprot:EFX78388.1 hypothetical protein DAPPUDRAFT_246339 [Daphnia pulex]
MDERFAADQSGRNSDCGSLRGTISRSHDVAIFTLESPVVYSDVISPVCLDVASIDPDEYAGQDILAIIGWGRTQKSGMSDTLQQATTWKNTDYAFCVYGSTGTCMDDSGGPLMVQSATGVWTPVGIVMQLWNNG